METVLSSSNCKNCGQPTTFSNLETESQTDFAALVCNLCKAWTVPVQIQNQLEEIYSKTYFHGGEYLNYNAGQKAQFHNFARKMKILKSHLRLLPTQRLLEIGSANGLFLDFLKQEEHFSNIMGVEVSPYARSEAQKKGHQILSPMQTNWLLEVQNFSPQLICAWDVWEHLEDPIAFFDQLFEASSRHVSIAITTVDCNQYIPQKRKTKWRQFHPPTHVNYPTGRSMQVYLKSRGFEIKHHGTFGRFRPLSEYLGAVFKFYREPISNLPAPFDFPVYLNLFDIQLVVAERKL